MGMLDANTVLSNAQAITSTAVSTSVINQGAASDAIANGSWVEFLVDTTFTSNGATVQFELQTATDEAFTSPITLFLTGAIPVATLVAGYRPARVRIPIGAKQYLRSNYTVASGPAAAGKVDCRIRATVDVDLP